jgi:hypothetical protein
MIMHINSCHTNANAIANISSQPTIDVEAAVREGRLDFGLFAPESRLDGGSAETVIDAMRREMSAMVTSFEMM